MPLADFTENVRCAGVAGPDCEYVDAPRAGEDDGDRDRSDDVCE